MVLKCKVSFSSHFSSPSKVYCGQAVLQKKIVCFQVKGESLPVLEDTVQWALLGDELALTPIFWILP